MRARRYSRVIVALALAVGLVLGGGVRGRVPRTVNGTGHTGPSEFCAIGPFRTRSNPTLAQP